MPKSMEQTEEMKFVLFSRPITWSLKVRISAYGITGVSLQMRRETERLMQRWRSTNPVRFAEKSMCTMRVYCHARLSDNHFCHE